MLHFHPGTLPRVARLGLASLLAAVASGCARAPDADAQHERVGPRVVCTVAMIADVAREVGGPHAEVISLMREGTDPHLYRPNRADVQTLLSADLVLSCGLHLEGKMTEVLERVSLSGTPVVPVAERIDSSLLLSPPGAASQHDPHVWMDPAAWSEVVGVVEESLARVLPDRVESLRGSADAYRARLGELHEYSERVLATVPPERRVLVTAHDAFEYFGARYTYEVVGIQGISTESEAGVRDIQRIVGLLVDRAIPAVFVESTVSERNVEALVEGAAARGHTVIIGASLFSDAMGRAGTYEGTYIGMIDHNVTAIARALGGEAPQRGMQGRLTP